MKPLYKNLISILLIFLLGIIVYSNTFYSSFHFDDKIFIIQNPAIRNIYNLHNILFFWHCRFVTFFSLALNYHFNGLDVFGYHFFNLGVHVLSAILVWWLTLLTLSSPVMKGEKIVGQANAIALLAGLIFVSHPVQIEAVTYIWQRAASMAAMFYLASLCFYVKSRLAFVLADKDTGKPAGHPYYVLSLITVVIAMFTKENTVTLPFMILIYEFTFFKTEKCLAWKYISPFLLTLFIIPVTFIFSKADTFKDLHGFIRADAIPSMHYLLTQFRVIFTYIRLAFLPVNQNIDYDYPIYRDIFELPVLISFMSLIIIFYSTVRLFSKYRLIFFSILWFFLTLMIPESSFWSMRDVIFEYRLYLPLAGYSIFLVSSVYYLWGKESTKTMVIIISLIVAFNSILTYQRNKVWKDEVTLWTDAIHKSPNKVRPYINRGSFYDDPSRYTQELSAYTKGIELDPKNPVFYFCRGVIYERRGDFNKALIEYTKALIIDPNYSPSFMNRGEIYAKVGQLNLALVEYSKAIEIDPKSVSCYFSRFQLYYRLKLYNKALVDLYKIRELGYAVDPGVIKALKKLSGEGH